MICYTEKEVDEMCRVACIHGWRAAKEEAARICYRAMLEQEKGPTSIISLAAQITARHLARMVRAIPDLPEEMVR